MKKIDSAERTTGMGASHSTRILVEGFWVKASNMPGARYHGRDHGVENYSVEVPGETRVAQFDRSNSGKETVQILDGPAFHSFEDAEEWGQAQAGLRERAGKCPTCGR